MKLMDKVKTFCGWMYKGNVSYLKWLDTNEWKLIIILVIIFAILPEKLFIAFIALFILFRMPHSGNWWYEWSDTEEENEERDNPTGK